MNTTNMTEEATSSARVESATSQGVDIRATLNNWTKERTNPQEGGARRLIANAINRDIARNEKGEEVPDVSGLTGPTTTDLESYMGDGAKISVKRKDSVTGEDIVSEVRRDSTGWVAEERAKDGRVISQARIGVGGTTELTLNYPGEHYGKINANPGLVADRDKPEATATTFNLLARSVLRASGRVEGHFAKGEKQRYESVEGKYKLDLKRQEIIKKVESGEDKEGNFLFRAVKQSFSESPDIDRFGVVGKTYQDARDSAVKIDDPAELERTIVSLRTFHEQIGLGKYEVKLEVPQGASEDERRRLIREKVKSDVERMPEQYAHYSLSDYYEHKANLEQITQETKGLVFQKPMYESGLSLSSLPDREEFREKAYDLQREADRVYWAGQRIVDKVGNDDVSKQYLELRRQRLSFEEEKFVPLSQRSQEEVDKLVTERINSIRRGISQDRGEEAAINFDHIDENRKHELAKDLAEEEEKTWSIGRNLLKSLDTEDADRICDSFSELRNSRVGVNEKISEIKVATATQRSKEAVGKLKDIRRKVATAGGIGRFPSKQEVGQLFTALKERLASKVGVYMETAEKELSTTLDPLIEKAETADDALLKGVMWVGEKLDATVGRAADTVGKQLKEAGEELKSEVRYISPEMERRRLETRRWLYESRHSVAVAKDRVLTEIGISRLALEKKAAVTVKRIIGAGVLSEEEQKDLSGQREKIERAQEGLRRWKSQELDERRRNNPHFEHFWKEIDGYVSEFSKPVVQPETASTTSEKSTEDKKVAASELRQGMKHHEVLRMYGEKGNYTNVLFWWDGEKVRTEQIKDDGTLIDSATDRYTNIEADTLDKAKEVIDKIVSEGTKDQKPEESYKRGLYFSKDKDGKDIIVEEGKEEVVPPEEKSKDAEEKETSKENTPEEQKHKDKPLEFEKLRYYEMVSTGENAFVVYNLNAIGQVRRRVVDEYGREPVPPVRTIIGSAENEEQARGIIEEDIGKNKDQWQPIGRGLKPKVLEKTESLKEEEKSEGIEVVPETQEKKEGIDGLVGLTDTEKVLVEDVVRTREAVNASSSKVKGNEKEKTDLAVLLIDWQRTLYQFNQHLTETLPVREEGIDMETNYGRYVRTGNELAEIVKSIREADKSGNLEQKSELLNNYNKLLYERKSYYDLARKESK